MPDDANKHIDQDWKAEAAREKEEWQQHGGESAEKDMGAGPLPEASFTTLVAGLRAQALIALGAIEDPALAGRAIDRDQAKYVIDTLSVLETKTAGNLSPEEKEFLDAVLYELRISFLRS